MTLEMENLKSNFKDREMLKRCYAAVTKIIRIFLVNLVKLSWPPFLPLAMKFLKHIGFQPKDESFSFHLIPFVSKSID